MSRSANGDLLWAQMTTAQQAEAVFAGRATLRQIVAGFLDGPDQLREACQQFLAHTDASLRQLIIEGESNGFQAKEQPRRSKEKVAHGTKERTERARSEKKRRLGLPTGYTPRVRRHERN
jgi:hypothetical protein